jgi:membrane-associated protease RseP (regulator of RpoE activity)
MRWLGCAPGWGIGVALLALTAACPFARGEDAPAAGRGAWIGVSTRAVSHAPREGRNSSVSGLQVIAVTPGSPAAEAGIEPGDILMRIDSRNLKVPDDLTTAELFMQSGRPVEVVLDRGGRTIMTFQMEPAPTPGTSAPLLLTGVPPATSAATDSSAGTGAGAGAPAGAGAQTSAGAAEGAAMGAGAVAGATIGAAGAGAAPGADAAADGGAARSAGGIDASSASGSAGSGGNAAAGVGAAAAVTLAATAAGGEPPASAPADSASADSGTVPVPPLAGAAGTATISTSAPAPPPSDVHSGAAGLGVRCENLSLDLAKALGAKPGQGVLVLTVTTGSPADRAGIRPGDVITYAADQQVADVERLDQILAKATSPLAVSTLRRGTTRIASVEFGDAGQAQDVTTLQNEVKSLQDEVRKLREELAKAKAHP